MPWLNVVKITQLRTERFVRLSDNFFDCLNVSNVYDGQRKREPDLEPYWDKDDYRLKVTVLTIFKIKS